jgi:hypothetical protein
MVTKNKSNTIIGLTEKHKIPLQQKNKNTLHNNVTYGMLS